MYFQDTWQPVDRAQVTLGTRMDRESIPTDEIPAAQAWATQTGVFNNGNRLTADTLGNITTDQVSSGFNFSPRLGLAYELGPNRDWVIHGGLGVFVGRVDPEMFGDLIGRSGAYEVRRGAGTLGGWPGVPDSTVAPVQGASLAVLNPDYEAPRTFRASVGIARDLGQRAALRLSMTYRHTDFLPRLNDLNRSVQFVSRDQYDRPIYGQLTRVGPAVVASPGTNRRFGGHDFVTAIDPSGYSDYIGLTAAIERQVGANMRLLAQYTWSETTDNWMSGAALEARLTPFPDSLNGRDWVDGVSDLDIPHRFVGGLVLDPSSLPVSVSVLYRMTSGRPYTPGFPAGVDANGDGSGLNDPAFIDASVPGMAALLTGSCLGGQAGQFAERNSCRMNTSHRVDARASLEIMRGGSVPVAVTVEGLNILDTEEGVVDAAVYRIDGGGAVTTTGGITTVPLTVNPNFGNTLYRTGAGIQLRVGLRIGGGE